MKKFFLSIVMSGFAVRGFCQGAVVVLDNINNTSMSPTATSAGLFWLSTDGALSLINQDFNAAFYGGVDSGSLSLLATFLLSDGTAVGVNSVGPGTFGDPQGIPYHVPGATITSREAFFQIRAWTGNYPSYAAAVMGVAPAAQSPIFLNPLYNLTGPPADMVGMPAIVLAVPEPSTFALVGLGGVFALVILRPKSPFALVGDYSGYAP